VHCACRGRRSRGDACDGTNCAVAGRNVQVSIVVNRRRRNAIETTQSEATDGRTGIGFKCENGPRRSRTVHGVIGPDGKARVNSPRIVSRRISPKACAIKEN
jgi:hypothetical protein